MKTTLNDELLALANELDDMMEGPATTDDIMEHVLAMRNAATHYGRLRVWGSTWDSLLPKMDQAAQLGVITEVDTQVMSFVVELQRCDAHLLLKREPNLGDWI